ncbi:MAG: hypothetical protein V5A38_01960 [Halolamina sp.]|jgi:hypothetical protein|uniref:hypothetical protein n=1 Tax=Halolamina sp. TaxID=1940283 RepID=UPI002FC2A908
MGRKTRRAVLGTSGVALLAGCSGFGSVVGGDSQSQAGSDTQDADGDGVPDTEDDFPENSTYSVEAELIDDERRIPEQEWARWSFDFLGETEISYEFTVRDGPAIDVLLFKADEYEHYANRDGARYLTATSVLDAADGSNTGTINPGIHYFVLDNTTWGDAAPSTNVDDDVATVEITLIGRR